MTNTIVIIFIVNTIPVDFFTSKLSKNLSPDIKNMLLKFMPLKSIKVSGRRIFFFQFFRFKQNGGTVIKRKIESFDDVRSLSVIFCTYSSILSMFTFHK